MPTLTERRAHQVACHIAEGNVHLAESIKHLVAATQHYRAAGFNRLNELYPLEKTLRRPDDLNDAA